MLTKKNLWYLTLFSIILVMAVYYVSIPPIENDKLVSNEISNKEDLSVTLNESESITALRVERDEILEHEVEAIKKILTDEEKTSEDKSQAYETLKNLNNNKGKEENLEKIIKENFNYENFVKIDGNKIKVTVDTNNHSYDLANKIIKLVQSEMNTKCYVTVSFAA